MRGSAAFRAAVAPGGVLAGPWVKNELWRRARAVPSLDLRFADNKSLVDATTGQNLVTFTRASSGTYVDSQGVIKTAVTNNQKYSEDFSQGLTPNNTTLTTNQSIAPDGNQTADQFLETTANGLHSQEIVDFLFVLNTTYTFSCFAKSIGGRTFSPGFPTSFGSARFGKFDLSGSGSVLATDTGVTASIQAYPNGWYRCSITSTCTTGGGARVGVFISSGTSISYAGDVTKGLFLWGAQLEQSSTVGEYIPTTSTINSAPRFDHNPTTGESLGLLVEEQRTNLVQQSADISNAYWTKSETTVTANAIAAPDGTTTAGKLIESTANSQHTLASAAITWAANTQYTATFYAKAAERSRFDILLGTAGNWVNSERVAQFDVNSGLITSSPNSPATASIQLVGNGWYRCRITATTTAAPTASAVFIRMCDATGLSSYTGISGNGIYLWGAQLEAGAFPTSYIPTTTAAVTRSADVASITGTAFSSWYRQDEGTVFVDGSAQKVDGAAGGFLTINDLSGVNRLDIRQYRLDPLLNGQGSALPTWQSTSMPTITANTYYKQALSYSASSQGNAISGLLQTSTNTVGLIQATRLALFMRDGQTSPSGNTGGTIRRLTYWPSRLPNNVLQEITR